MDGERLTLALTVSKKWDNRERTPVFKGYETKRSINGRSVSKEEYTGLIESMGDVVLLKLLTNPAAMEFVPWVRLREIIVKLSPKVPYRALSLESLRLKEIADLVTDNTPEEALKALTENRNRIKAALSSIPHKRGEVLMNMGEEGDSDEVEIKIKGVKEEISETERLMLLKSKDSSKKSELLRLEEIKHETELRLREKELERQKALMGLERKIRDKEADIRLAEKENTAFGNRLSETSKRLKELKERIDKLSAEELRPELYCKLCGNKLKKAQLRELEEKLKKERKTRLEELYRKYELESFEETRLKDSICKNTGITERLKKEINILGDELAGLRIKKPDSKAPTEIDKAIERLNRELKPDFDELEELRAIYDGLNKKLETLYEKKSGIITNNYAKKRLEILSREEAELKEEYKALKYKETLINELIRKSTEYSCRVINSHFETVNFRLFRSFINGGSESCCVAEIDGVDYRDLNHGGRIKAGLELIKGLSEFFDIHLPVFIDNRESLTGAVLPEGQIFELTVSDEKELSCYNV